MSDRAVKRPPLLAGACFYLGLLSAILAVRGITLVSSWNGDNRASDFSGPLQVLRDAGMGASDAETLYKAMLTGIAVLAACGVVFAVYTARGDRSSRVGLTVAVGVSGLVAFAGGLGASFFFVLVGAFAIVFSVRLWTGDIRTYFRTLAGHEPPAPVAEPVQVAPPAEPVDPFLPSSPPTQAYAPQPGRKEPLPKPVAIAVWTALIGSIAAVAGAGLMLLMVLVLGIDYDTVMEQGGPSADMVRGSEGNFDTAMRLLVALCSISVVLGVGGLLAAIRVLVTRRSGDVLLFVMTVVTLVFSVVGFPLGLPWTVAAIVALVQLRKPDARRWFAASKM